MEKSSVTDVPSGPIIKEGWLSKKSEKKKAWTNKWIVIKSEWVGFFKKQGDLKPKTASKLRSAFIASTARRNFCIGVKAGQRLYLLLAKSAEETHSWIAAFNKANVVDTAQDILKLHNEIDAEIKTRLADESTSDEPVQPLSPTRWDRSKSHRELRRSADALASQRLALHAPATIAVSQSSNAASNSSVAKSRAIATSSNSALNLSSQSPSGSSYSAISPLSTSNSSPIPVASAGRIQSAVVSPSTPPIRVTSGDNLSHSSPANSTEDLSKSASRVADRAKIFDSVVMEQAKQVETAKLTPAQMRQMRSSSSKRLNEVIVSKSTSPQSSTSSLVSPRSNVGSRQVGFASAATLIHQPVASASASSSASASTMSSSPSNGSFSPRAQHQHQRRTAPDARSLVNSSPTLSPVTSSSHLNISASFIATTFSNTLPSVASSTSASVSSLSLSSSPPVQSPGPSTAVSIAPPPLASSSLSLSGTESPPVVSARSPRSRNVTSPASSNFTQGIYALLDDLADLVEPSSSSSSSSSSSAFASAAAATSSPATSSPLLSTPLISNKLRAFSHADSSVSPNHTTTAPLHSVSKLSAMNASSASSLPSPSLLSVPAGDDQKSATFRRSLLVVLDEERRIADLRQQKASVQQQILSALELKMQLDNAIKMLLEQQKKAEEDYVKGIEKIKEIETKMMETMERSEKSRQAVVSIGESQPDEAKKVVTDVRVQLEKERERAATGRQKNPKRFLKATSVSNLDQKQTPPLTDDELKREKSGLFSGGGIFSLLRLGNSAVAVDLPTPTSGYEFAVEEVPDELWVSIRTSTPSKKWVEGIDVSSAANASLIVPISSGEFNVEFGCRTVDSNFHSADLRFLDADLYIQYYLKFFVNKEHINYVGYDEIIGPVIVSVLEAERGAAKDKKVRAIVRTARAVHRVLVPPKDKRKGIATALPDLAHVKLERCDDAHLQLDLVSFERPFAETQYKFGVLYIREGQTEEDHFYRNTETSPQFDEFLEFLGEKIVLKGWQKFRGGLNITHDSTGKHSYYTSFNGFEIMYHVTTMLPFFPDDPQQVERKRHLGNDVVLLVFKDSKSPPFNPMCIRSQFNHVFMVVQVDESVPPPKKHYKVAFVTKLGVPSYSPFLPVGGSFEKNAALRDFMLTKLINAERACMYAPDFLGKNINTRKLLLADIVAKYGKKLGIEVKN